MNNAQMPPPPVGSAPPPPPSTPDLDQAEQEVQLRRAGIIGGIVFLVVLVLIVLASVWMYNHPAETAVLRDMFIIFMALMLVFNGLVMVVLLFQLARLTNMLQHEIKPILENTNETVEVLRGTALFISEHVTEPVMKINGYVNGLSRFLELIIPGAARPPKSE